MSETFVAGDLVLPGTFIRVRAEGLIGVGGVSSGNIGIVGLTTAALAGETKLLSSVAEAEAAFGAPVVKATAPVGLNLTAMIAELYRNGARTVYARGTTAAGYEAALTELLKEDVQILVAPDVATTAATALLNSAITAATTAQRDVIAVLGADGATLNDVKGQAVNQEDGRLIVATPGYVVLNPAAPNTTVTLPGNYVAGPVAALISSLAPHVSPTNKMLPGVMDLATRYSYSERKDLVNSRVLTLERRGGVRVVRGVTTEAGGFKQITTRRIVDYAKQGIRQVADPFIGRLNNVRVRAALQSAIDGLLTSMLVDEQLTAYQLEVTATRRDEIEGRAIVNVLLQPTFSIDYVAVTIVLQ
jgi:hypothetical protein